MAARKTRCRAFTIVELLTVVTILSILVAMLTPYLTKAREITKRALCLSNQKTIAEAFIGYAGAHDGRMVGQGEQIYVYPNGTTTNGMTWMQILNYEWFRNGNNWGDSSCINARMPWPPGTSKGGITCPSWRNWPGITWGVDAYQYNDNLGGGPKTNLNNPPMWKYGLAVDPNKVNYMYDHDINGRFFGYEPQYGGGPYCLGAQLARVRRPDYLFMVIETEYNNGTFGYGNVGSYILNGSSGTPPWSNSTYQLAFRHCLPPDESLYQDQATACFSYADGHVAVVNAVPGIVESAHIDLDW